MKKLHLIRHAKSSWDDPSWSDFERPLNERGWRNAPFMAERFAQTNAPDALVSSPAVRAITTARIFADKLKLETIHERKEIYEAPVLTLLQVLNGFSSAWNEVAMFGHNPGLSMLTHYLTGEYIELPTCAIVSIDLFADEWFQITAGAGRCSALDYPKKYTI